MNHYLACLSSHLTKMSVFVFIKCILLTYFVVKQYFSRLCNFFTRHIAIILYALKATCANLLINVLDPEISLIRYLVLVLLIIINDF